MLIKTHVLHKEIEVTAEDFYIAKVINLNGEDFNDLCEDLSSARDFIKQYNEEAHDNPTQCKDAMLVICDEKSFGILIDSQGYDYPRYSAVIPHAKDILKYERMNPALKDYCERISKKVDEIVHSAIENYRQGKYSFNLSDLNDEIGDIELDKALIFNMLFERDEFENVDEKNGEVTLELTDHSESMGIGIDDDHYLDEDFWEEAEILCAKHILWLYHDADSRFDLDSYRIVNLDFDNKNLCGARINNSIVRNCSFKNASLCDFTAQNTKFINCNFNEAVAEESSMTNCKFENCTFTKAIVTHSDLSGSNFVDCSYLKTSFDGCLIKNTGFLTAEGDVAAILPSLKDATLEESEFNSEYGVGPAEPVQE